MSFLAFQPPAKTTRGHIVATEAQLRGRITHYGLPGIPSMSSASAARPAPGIGANNDQVLGEFLPSEKVAELKEKRAIK